MADAQRILDRISGPETGGRECNDIRKAIREENTGFRQLWAPGMRTALVVGLVLPFLTQLTGITAVMYYAPAIFEKAGLGAGSAMSSAAIIGFFNMLFTFLAIWKIDKWGRKPLLVGGFIGLGAALLVIGTLFGAAETPSAFLLGAFIFYIAVFAATIGPGVWVVLSEIYPTAIRGRAMSLGTLSLFLGSSFVTQTYPLLRESAGIGWTFVLYGVLMLPAAWFVAKMTPETKGKTLEEIGQYWKGANAKTEQPGVKTEWTSTKTEGAGANADLADTKAEGAGAIQDF
jgi:SP family arabinose:H+ symporter-like MFS transporter